MKWLLSLKISISVLLLFYCSNKVWKYLSDEKVLQTIVNSSNGYSITIEEQNFGATSSVVTIVYLKYKYSLIKEEIFRAKGPLKIEVKWESNELINMKYYCYEPSVFLKKNKFNNISVKFEQKSPY